jgi:hypothetical protein
MMKQEFAAWWNDDNLTYENPFKEETPAFWAWEGWIAGVKAEREACAEAAGIALLGADRALTERVLKAIRARSEK